uniref:Uncharacterized protein n=1 Tax=Sphaerodactylus townsendi TaxID=933632 RepID=A0ACB8EPF2_9SAUR
MLHSFRLFVVIVGSKRDSPSTARPYNKTTDEPNLRQVQRYIKAATTRIHPEGQITCDAENTIQEVSLMNLTQDLKDGGELEFDPPALRVTYNQSSPAGPTWAQELSRVKAEIHIAPKEYQMEVINEPFIANLPVPTGDEKRPNGCVFIDSRGLLNQIGTDFHQSSPSKQTDRHNPQSDTNCTWNPATKNQMTKYKRKNSVHIVEHNWLGRESIKLLFLKIPEQCIGYCFQRNLGPKEC